MQQAQAMFKGEPINATEQRAVLHVALRGSHVPNPPWGHEISKQVANELHRVCTFAEKVREGHMKGHGGESITDVVNLGIGGSDLGPRMTTEALSHLTRDSFKNKVRVHYVSNVDAWSLYTALAYLNPARTAFVVQSKTFTTQETMTLAASAKRWLTDGGCPEDQLGKHLIAVTANPHISAAQGFTPEHTFGFWDWVGGRYSVWSAIGLPLAISIGAFAFQDMLLGARAMDEHFLNAPLEHNAPVQMALSAVANRSVLGYGSFALCPYDARLGSLVPWLQQLEMESLGKATLRDGSTLDVPSSPVVWGMPGTDSQHTFFQWLHQDGKGAPVDFILCAVPDHRHTRHHRLLIANCLAQRAALLEGKTYEQSLKEVSKTEKDPEKAAVLAHHHVHPGGRPSTLIVLPKLEARQLGALLALYEHKVFTEGVLWGINPFDQWGVEFGKRLAGDIERRLDALGSDPAVSPYDPSTAYWVRKLASG
jgi:glucose-6-phosphate isomerase